VPSERGVAFAVAGALTIAFSAILVRLAKVSPETAAFFRCAYAVPPLAALAWWERRRLGPRPRGAWRLTALAGDLRALPELQRSALLMRELTGLSHK